MSILIADALAAATQASDANSSMVSSVLMMLGFVLIFYFLLWRPQSKRAKEHRELLAKVGQGDEVVTAGGLTGKVARLSEGFVVLIVGESTEIIVQKQAITMVLPKGTLKAI